MSAQSETRLVLATIFGRLFENEFATIDGIALSCRTPDGMEYVEGTDALRWWLGGTTDEPAGGDPRILALHRACHAAAPAHDAVISGWSRHLRALMLEGHGVPRSTSMMRNRGVPDLSVHVVEPDALAGSALAATLDRARSLAQEHGMRHHLLITTEGYVVASGAPPYELMAHWHNVEMAARIEVLRLEDSMLEEAG